MRSFAVMAKIIIVFVCLLNLMVSAEAGSLPEKKKIFPEPKVLPITVSDGGGTLIYSDCPEYVKEPGILYSDVVSGNVRVFYYHLNDSHEPSKIAVLLKSVEKGLVANVTKGVISQPGEDYFAVGRGLQAQYFSAESDKKEMLLVKSTKARLLAPEMDEIVVGPAELISGVYDFSVNGQIRLTVLSYPAKDDPVKYLETAKMLPEEIENREGTFSAMNREITLCSPYNPSTDGIACIVLANGKEDYFLNGVSATDGQPVENFGNYGVNYRIVLPVAEPGRTHYYLEPLGGVYSGIMRVHLGNNNSRLIFTPEGRYFGENGAGEYADLGAYDNNVPLWFEFSPPGASNLPVRIIMVPEIS